MGLKYYLNLFKGDENNRTVRRRYRTNSFVLLAYFALFISYFLARGGNIILSSVLGILTFLSVVLYRLLALYFDRTIERLIDAEPLDCDDEIDTAFCKYRQGYAQYRNKTKRLNRYFLPLNIAAAVLFLGFIPATVVLDLMGKTDLSGRIYSVVGIVALIFLTSIFVFSTFYNNKGVWTQDCYLEIAQINRYKAKNGTAVVKYKISEDKKPIVQLGYMFKDDDLRRKYVGLSKFTLRGIGIFSALLGVVLGATIIAASKFPDKQFLFKALMAGIWIVAGLYIAATVVIAIIQSKILKKQYKLLMESPDENALYLGLHRLRTPFVRRWNILLLVCLFGNIISNLVFAGVVSYFAGGGYGWIFFLLFWVELIAMFVVYFKHFGRVRLQMIPIEDEIDLIKQEPLPGLAEKPDEIQ